MTDTPKLISSGPRIGSVEFEALTPPGNPIETKVELVIEAFESLALACAASVAAGGGARSYSNVVAARKDARDALRVFLQPTLRVIGQ